MRREIVYGAENCLCDGKFIEVFFDDTDRRVGINWTNEKTSEVSHFILKDGYIFDGIVALIKNYVSDCADIVEAHDILETFLDEVGQNYLDDYPDYIPEMRTEEEIGEYMAEAFNRVWLVRKQNMLCNMLMGEECVNADVLDRCNKAIDEVCEKYDIDFKEPVSDWYYGYWSGIFAALRWVMGDEKDMLDT